MPNSHEGDKRDSPYFCSGSQRLTQGGYRYGILQLRFPQAEYAPDGSARSHTIVFMDPAGVVSQVECIVPNTDAAVRRLYRVLGVNREEQRGRSDAVALSSGDTYYFDTVYVCPWGGIYPNCYGRPRWEGAQCEATDPSCGGAGWSGGDGGDGWDWGGGGETSDPPDPDDDDDEEEDRPPCDRMILSTGEPGPCKGKIPDEEGWQFILGLIDGMQENNEHCAGAKQQLQLLASYGREAGRLLLWDGHGRRPGTQDYGDNLFYPNGNRYIQWDEYWLRREPVLLVHEAMHAWFAAAGMGPGNTETFAITWHRLVDTSTRLRGRYEKHTKADRRGTRAH